MSGEKWSFADTVPGVMGRFSEVGSDWLEGQPGNQEVEYSSTANRPMPRVRQALFPLQNHPKTGGPHGHTHLIFGWKTPYEGRVKKIGKNDQQDYLGSEVAKQALWKEIGLGRHQKAG